MFGELSDFPFPELIGMLGRRTGCLLLENLEGGLRYELYVHDGQLRSMTGTHGPFLHEDHVRRHFWTLATHTSGAFSFKSVPQAILPQHFNLAFADLLQSSTTEVDEYRQLQGQFHHPDTCFELTADSSGKLPHDLAVFLGRAHEHLRSGASATELALALHLTLPEVQLKLYKLRQAGEIEPRRTRETPEAPNSRVGQIVTRLLGSLMRKQNARSV